MIIAFNQGQVQSSKLKLGIILSNRINSKSLGLEVAFQIISNSNYKKVDIKIYNPQNDYNQRFFLESNISFGCIKERSE